MNNHNNPKIVGGGDIWYYVPPPPPPWKFVGGRVGPLSPSPYIDAHDLTRRGATFILDNGQRGAIKALFTHNAPHPLTLLSGQTWRRAWSHQSPSFFSEDIHCYKFSFLWGFRATPPNWKWLHMTGRKWMLIFRNRQHSSFISSRLYSNIKVISSKCLLFTCNMYSKLSK